MFLVAGATLWLVARTLTPGPRVPCSRARGITQRKQAQARQEMFNLNCTIAPRICSPLCSLLCLGALQASTPSRTPERAVKDRPAFPCADARLVGRTRLARCRPRRRRAHGNQPQPGPRDDRCNAPTLSAQAAQNFALAVYETRDQRRQVWGAIQPSWMGSH